MQTAGKISPNLRLGLLCLAFGLLFSLSVFVSPLIGSLLGIAAPIPLAMAYLLGGGMLGTLVLAATVILTGAAAGGGGLFFSILQAGLPGFLIAFGIRKRLSYPMITLMVTGLVLTAHLAASFVFVSVSPTGGGTYIQSEMDNAFETMNEYFEGYQKEGDESVVSLERYREVFAGLFPGLFVLGILINSLFCILVCVRLLSGRYKGLPSFTSWRLPDSLIWLFIAAVLGVAIGRETLWGIPAGLAVIIAALYTIQGTAVALDFAEKRKVSLWIRYLAGIFVLIQLHLLIIFMILGLLDFRFDFRRPKESIPA